MPIRKNKTRNTRAETVGPRTPDFAGSSTAIAYRTVKGHILANQLHPGDAINADYYARRLGLSRTPLREALLRLEREGLIEVRPRMGTFVAHIDLRQIQESYETRRVLEGYAARLAATRVSMDRVEMVERQLDSLSTDQDMDCKALSEAGQQVHQLIVSSCGNGVLSKMILSLQDHFARYRTLSLQLPEKVLSSHREHLEILRALKARDGDLAEALTQEHFEHAARYLLESLLNPGVEHRSARLCVSPVR